MFELYEFLTVETVPEYISSVPQVSHLIDVAHLASVKEIGDGNLNLVFLATDQSGNGLVLKQALPYVRMTGEGWSLTPERARTESESLQADHALVPDLVVKVFNYNPQRHIIVMEDLSDHELWRGALNQGMTHDGAAEAVGTYVGIVAFGTSVFGMERQEWTTRQSALSNLQLCAITEDLVFSEPYVDAGLNAVLAANELDAKDLAADEEMVAAMGYAKWLFMTRAEALIHGDLHTGSVLVRAPEGSSSCDSVKVFDSEFASYGPVAFDLGAIWANYVIAAARAFALGDDERGDWVLSLTSATWAGFETEFRRRWPERIDPRVWRDDFLDHLLSQWREESRLFAAAKMARRMVGPSKTTDIETLPEARREGATRGILHVARKLVREREKDRSPEDLIELVRMILTEDRTM
jgi:5-methylthioribose kinase